MTEDKTAIEGPETESTPVLASSAEGETQVLETSPTEDGAETNDDDVTTNGAEPEKGTAIEKRTTDLDPETRQWVIQDMGTRVPVSKDIQWVNRSDDAPPPKKKRR